MKSAIQLAGAIALLSVAAFFSVVAFIAFADVRPAIRNWGAVPGEIGELRAAVLTVPAQVAGMVLPVAQQEIRHAGDRLIDEVHGARKDLSGQIDSARLEILGPDGRFVALQSAVLQRADAGLRILDQTRTEGIQPVLAATAGTIAKLGSTADTYSRLPAELAASPSWLAIQPEITCRQLDGSGYGGCWHGRITALMGEAARVGGVFTQKFPSLADSVTGIASDAHGFSAKYVMPHPMKTGDYFKAAGKITIGLGAAGLRGGVF